MHITSDFDVSKSMVMLLVLLCSGTSEAAATAAFAAAALMDDFLLCDKLLMVDDLDNDNDGIVSIGVGVDDKLLLLLLLLFLANRSFGMLFEYMELSFIDSLKPRLRFRSDVVPSYDRLLLALFSNCEYCWALLLLLLLLLFDITKSAS